MLAPRPPSPMETSSSGPTTDGGSECGGRRHQYRQASVLGDVHFPASCARSSLLWFWELYPHQTGSQCTTLSPTLRLCLDQFLEADLRCGAKRSLSVAGLEPPR